MATKTITKVTLRDPIHQVTGETKELIALTSSSMEAGIRLHLRSSKNVFVPWGNILLVEYITEQVTALGDEDR